MIKISNKAECTGCAACYSACPEECIEMEIDEEGFKYPVVDEKHQYIIFVEGFRDCISVPSANL